MQIIIYIFVLIILQLVCTVELETLAHIVIFYKIFFLPVKMHYKRYFIKKYSV